MYWGACVLCTLSTSRLAFPDPAQHLTQTRGGGGGALGETTTPPASLWLTAITATSLRGAARGGTQTSPLPPPIKSMDWSTFRTPPTPRGDIITYYSTEGFFPTWALLHIELVELTAAAK